MRDCIALPDMTFRWVVSLTSHVMHFVLRSHYLLRLLHSPLMLVFLFDSKTVSSFT